MQNSRLFNRCDIDFIWMSQNLTNEDLTLVQVIAVR